MKTRKIVIACDSFKGSLSSSQVGQACHMGITDAATDLGIDIATDIITLGDGGEGTLHALMDALQASPRSVSVLGPLGDPVNAVYGLTPDGLCAVIEMAAASGINLVQAHKRDAMKASSYGTGQMILHAMHAGAQSILIGIGGSATTDGGMGMLQALGYRFYDSHNHLLDGSGEALSSIHRIDTDNVDPRLHKLHITCACDVNNPLYGANGAARIFAPQKGATPEMVAALDRGLRNYAAVSAHTPGHDLSHLPGSGAAGGVGFALRTFLNAKLIPGIQLVLDAIDFDRHLIEADLVITGEGRLDRQTSMGKAPSGVLLRAAKHSIPVIAIAGSIDPDIDFHAAGFAAVFPILQQACTLQQALDPQSAARNVRNTVRNIIHSINL